MTDLFGIYKFLITDEKNENENYQLDQLFIFPSTIMLK